MSRNETFLVPTSLRDSHPSLNFHIAKLIICYDEWKIQNASECDLTAKLLFDKFVVLKCIELPT